MAWQILKYKTQWVAHGNKQEEEIDYVETFAAFAKLMSWKYIFAVRLKRSYRIRYMNVVTAFLYDLLDKFIYVK